MADDVLLLMDGLGLASASLVGHAAGGVIGLTLALSHPERIERLVVINGWSRAHPHTLTCFATRLALLRDSGVEAFVRAQPLFLYPSRWIDDEFDRLAAGVAQQIAHFQGAANVEARIAALAVFDIDARLAEIDAQVLLVAAEDDMLVPPQCSERLHSGLSAATLIQMSGGHACNVTIPDDFNRILCEWLGRAHLKGVH